MPSCSRGIVSVSLSVAIACLTLSSAAHGVEVWSGLTFSFDHPASSSTQDEITPNVWLTRGSAYGLYNASSETAYVNDYSPEFTLWATEINNSGAEVTATNWSELSFVDWRTAYGGPYSLASNIVGTDIVVYLVLDDVYLDIQFTSWGVGIGGLGAFSYLRAQPPAPEATGDYNGNHVVDAADYTTWRDRFGQAVTPNGSGADGDADGTIDDGDYDFWKSNFGDVIPPGAGGASAVPEPSILTLAAIGLLTLALATVRARL